MKVLVVDQPGGCQQAALLLDGIDVVTTDIASAKSAVERTAFDVVLARWPTGMTAPRAAEALVKTVRESRPEYTAVMFMGEGSGSTAALAFNAGVDDWVERPLDGALLKARVRRAARIAALERVAGKDPSLAQRQQQDGPIQRLGPWRTFPMLNAVTLTELFGVKFVVANDLGDFKPTHATEIRLNLTNELIEVPLVIEMDERGLAALGRTMFGGDEGSVAAQIDMLLEIANTIAGTFSRQALNDKTEMTIGLPASLSVDQALRDMTVTDDRRKVMLKNDELGVRMSVSIGVRSRSNIRIPVTKVREGMVLAADLVSEKGVLLMKAGTRFSATQARRVIGLLPETNVVEVADAAA